MTDQRGVARPFGTGCDVGAYELDFKGFLPPINNVRTNPIHPGKGVPIQFILGGDHGLAIFAAGSPSSVRDHLPTLGCVGRRALTVTAGQQRTLVRSEHGHVHLRLEDRQVVGRHLPPFVRDLRRRQRAHRGLLVRPMNFTALAVDGGDRRGRRDPARLEQLSAIAGERRLRGKHIGLKLLVHGGALRSPSPASPPTVIFKLEGRSTAAMVSLVSAAVFGFVPLRDVLRIVFRIEGKALHIAHGLGSLALIGLPVSGVVSSRPFSRAHGWRRSR